MSEGMDKIAAWRAAREAVSEAYAAERHALEIAEDVPLPADLRPAVASDIVENAIIWYVDADRHYWREISTVHCPDDDFKAYTGHDGARYGLQNAFVPIEK